MLGDAGEGHKATCDLHSKGSAELWTSLKSRSAISCLLQIFVHPWHEISIVNRNTYMKVSDLGKYPSLDNFWHREEKMAHLVDDAGKTDI